MREEEIGVALRAAADDLDRFWSETGGEKLAAVGFNEIDVKAGPDGRMAGRASWALVLRGRETLWRRFV